MLILVATWSDGLFAVSDDRCTHEIQDVGVRGLAPDGQGGVLGIAGGHMLRRRSPSGEWSTVVTSEFPLACCMTVQGATYVGTDTARMLRLSDGNELVPVEGFDKVAGREDWFAGSAMVDGQRVGPPLGIRSVAANADGSVLFANVHVGGIPRSTDGGASWQPTIAIEADVHEVRAHPVEPDLVVAASAMGLCISHDAGATWRMEREGLHAPHCSAVAFVGDDVLVSASTNPFAEQGKIYRRSIVPDGVIEAVEGGLPAWTEGKADTGCIASRGAEVAIADGGGRLFVSTDYGRTWSPRGRRPLPGPSCVMICG